MPVHTLMTLRGIAELKLATLCCRSGCVAYPLHRSASTITGSTYTQGHLGGIIGGREEGERSREEAGKDKRGMESNIPVGGCCRISGCM